MVEQALPRLATVDPEVLGDPAAAEEYQLEVMESAVNVTDVDIDPIA